jgi:hypothetical protein
MRVEAYTDESGHTGLKLFDAKQPWFWTGTLVTHPSLQSRGAQLVQDLSASLGRSDLHANQLGLAKLELVVGSLQDLLTKVDAHFVFTAIEKRHLASGKLADAVLDSTMNQAVSPLHYGTHGFRLLLAHALVEITGPVDQEDFWAAYTDGDRDQLGRVLARLLLRLASFPEIHPRLRELLSDALVWGKRHPDALLEFRRSQGDSPNLVAFNLLMDGIHGLLAGSGFKVGRFVHDQQQEFGSFMKEWFPVTRRFVIATHATARITDFQEIDTYDCRIEILPSNGVVGLQLIDVVLWLYRRSISDEMKSFPKCEALVQFVHERAEIRQHSKAQLARDAERCYRDIMGAPLDTGALEKGHRVVDEIEQARKSRMWSS